MQLAAFVQALGIGLAIAAPVGPIGLLVIQRTLRAGTAVGLATGLGAALADAAYAAVGAWGVHAVTTAMQSAQRPLAVFGGALLLWLAWRTWRAPPPPLAVDRRAAPPPRRTTLLAALSGALLLTLANPATMVSFAAVFGAIGARDGGASPATLVAGVFVGSAAWWLVLCIAVGTLRARFDERHQRAVARASAAALAAFALWAWAGA